MHWLAATAECVLWLNVAWDLLTWHALTRAADHLLLPPPSSSCDDVERARGEGGEGGCCAAAADSHAQLWCERAPDADARAMMGWFVLALGAMRAISGGWLAEGAAAGWGAELLPAAASYAVEALCLCGEGCAGRMCPQRAAPVVVLCALCLALMIAAMVVR